MKQFLKVESVAQATPPPVAPNPAPHPSPTWGMVTNLIADAGLLDAKTKAKFAEGAKQFTAALKGQNGFSHADGRAEFKQLVRDALDGKVEAKNLPTKEHIINRNAVVRQTAKRKAAEISREYRLVAAEILEKALNHFPKYREKLLAAEAAVYSGPKNEGKSPLQLLLDETPAFIETHITKLRADTGACVNPASIFETN